MSAPLREGERLTDDLEVVAHLSRNVALDVYDVWSDAKLCRCIAKLLRPDQHAPERRRARLRREGELLGELAHPHLVRGYGLQEGPDGGPVVVLETLSGQTLELLLERLTRRLALLDVLVLGEQLASGLHELHRHGVLHLDVKPGNVVCTEAGHAKIIDLSLARAPGPGSRGYGSPPYLAPEQARGEPFGPAADVWGLGVVLWEALCGRRAFPESEPGRYEQAERPAEPVRAHRRVPGAVTDLVAACLQPAPAARPALREVFDALATLE